MNAPTRTVRAVSFVAAALVTVSMLAAVAGLAQPPVADAWLAQTSTATVLR